MQKTREKVIESAKTAFIEKGFEGARMQEIADMADINKGLLHYYFKSKENLFHAVVSEVVEKVVPEINILFNDQSPLTSKITNFVDFYIDILSQNPYLPAFVLSEMNMKGRNFIAEILNKYKINPLKLTFQIEKEIREGKIREIHPFNLLLNILSMCIFPFVARPILQEVTGLTEEDYLKLMKLRKKEVSEFIIRAIKP